MTLSVVHKGMANNIEITGREHVRRFSPHALTRGSFALSPWIDDKSPKVFVNAMCKNGRKWLVTYAIARLGRSSTLVTYFKVFACSDGEGEYTVGRDPVISRRQGCARDNVR